MVPNDLAIPEASQAEARQPLFQEQLAESRALLEACRNAKAAAEAERDKAAQASAAALAAKAAAEADRDLAAKAKAAAETECDLTTKAKAAAETDRDLAAQARAAADAAKVAAEAERDQATQAKVPALEAKVVAETQRDLATQARMAGDAAKVVTETERDQATQSKIAADAAKAAAETARVQATEANTGANAAKVAAESERDQAIQARVAAEAAKVAADVAMEMATKAAHAAESEATRAARAHNLSTTAGLAGAFNEKAIKAGNRENLWSWVLVFSLVAAGSIGWFRYDDLLVLIGTNADFSTLIAKLLVAVLSVGAPVWLAWMATRMISKNQSIAVDYDYKASLAKAYIGFKQEAHGLDPVLEQRLFAAAITQLDANPVRFLDRAHPGSPLQDLLQQPFMNEVLQDATVKQKLTDWLNSRFKKI